MHHPPHILVVFGGSGDLARRKILPALGAIISRGMGNLKVLTVGRSEGSRTLEQIKSGFPEAVGGCFDYFRMQYDEAGFAALKQRCESLSDSRAVLLFHLAVPPSAFAGIVGGLDKAGLVRPETGAAGSRLLVEKPFGTDIATSRVLNEVILKSFPDEQVFRIDHYLGKPAVYFPLALRMGKGKWEEIWNRDYIRRIKITSRETAGCDERSGYFEDIGILRDMIQSHLMQLLSLVLARLPSEAAGKALCGEKAKALAKVRPKMSGGRPVAIRGRYSGGHQEGRPIPAYKDESGVVPGSRTETYAAVELLSESPRWRGVSIILEAGKRMSKKETLVEIEFRKDIRSAPAMASMPSRIVFRVQPEPEAWAESADGSKTGLGLNHASAILPDSEISGTGDGYAVLLQRALAGNSSFSVQESEIESAWVCLQPFLADWADAENDASIIEYPPGTESLLEERDSGLRPLPIGGRRLPRTSPKPMAKRAGPPLAWTPPQSLSHNQQ